MRTVAAFDIILYAQPLGFGIVYFVQQLLYGYGVVGFGIRYQPTFDGFASLNLLPGSRATSPRGTKGDMDSQ